MQSEIFGRHKKVNGRILPRFDQSLVVRNNRPVSERLAGHITSCHGPNEAISQASCPACKEIKLKWGEQ